MTDRVRSVVFPVAGLGTRFLPATKASPKEMLPIVDKPLIQYAVEEAVAAGADTLVFVTGRTKRAIEDHFDRAGEVERRLQASGKQALLNATRGTVPSGVNCVFVRQPAPRGLGDAILRARPVVGREPFGVILADDLVDGAGNRPVLAQMLDAYGWNRRSIVGVERVSPEQAHHYGVVSVQADGGRLCSIDAIVEKPPPGQAPSSLAVVGRYILTPAIFDALAETPPDAMGDLQLTDAIARVMRREEVYAYEFVGRRFDCGTRLGYLQAMVAYGLRHPELRGEFGAYLDQLIASGRLDGDSRG